MKRQSIFYEKFHNINESTNHILEELWCNFGDGLFVKKKIFVVVQILKSTFALQDKIFLQTIINILMKELKQLALDHEGPS